MKFLNTANAVNRQNCEERFLASTNLLEWGEEPVFHLGQLFCHTVYVCTQMCFVLQQASYKENHGLIKILICDQFDLIFSFLFVSYYSYEYMHKNPSGVN